MCWQYTVVGTSRAKKSNFWNSFVARLAIIFDRSSHTMSDFISACKLFLAFFAFAAFVSVGLYMIIVELIRRTKKWFFGLFQRNTKTAQRNHVGVARSSYLYRESLYHGRRNQYNNHDDDKIPYRTQQEAEAVVREMKQRGVPHAERLNSYFNHERQRWFVGNSNFYWVMWVGQLSQEAVATMNSRAILGTKSLVGFKCLLVNN